MLGFGADFTLFRPVRFPPTAVVAKAVLGHSQSAIIGYWSIIGGTMGDCGSYYCFHESTLIYLLAASDTCDQILARHQMRFVDIYCMCSWEVEDRTYFVLVSAVRIQAAPVL